MTQTRYTLVIGNRNYSSWSLRAWLFLRESQVRFDEIRIPVYAPTWPADIARYSPAGRVPVLLDREIAVWDSTAIMEYVRERHPEAVGWPASPAARAHAQSISAEMHSGFLGIRDELPQNLRARSPRAPSGLSESCRDQIARIDDIWSDCRQRYGQNGKWLFGEFSLADIMYAPVALRFLTYGISISESAAEFQQAVCDLATVEEWIAAAGDEQEVISFIDDLVPSSQSPLTLG